MRIEESSDGTIKVVELDPAKRYWFIVSQDAAACRLRLSYRDGSIIRIPAGGKIEIIENVDGLEVKPEVLAPCES